MIYHRHEGKSHGNLSGKIVGIQGMEAEPLYKPHEKSFAPEWDYEEYIDPHHTNQLEKHMDVGGTFCFPIEGEASQNSGNTGSYRRPQIYRNRLFERNGAGHRHSNGYTSGCPGGLNYHSESQAKHYA